MTHRCNAPTGKGTRCWTPTNEGRCKRHQEPAEVVQKPLRYERLKQEVARLRAAVERLETAIETLRVEVP